MYLEKKNFEDFYNELRNQFPSINELNTWSLYDWRVNGYKHSLIMSELAIETANLLSHGQLSETEEIMNIVEKYFHEGDTPVISILYSDFLVTIMETKKETREALKKMMGTQTINQYNRLLYFYREADA